MENKPEIMGGGFAHTFGSSKAAIHLTTNILAKEEYKLFKRKVCHLLSKQIEVFNSIMMISNIRVRKTTLKLWHDRFNQLTDDLPEVVKTHTRCVETGIFRQMLKSP